MLMLCFRTFTIVCVIFFTFDVLIKLKNFLSNQHSGNWQEEKGTMEVLLSTFKNLGLCLIFVLQHIVMASEQYRSYLSKVPGWMTNLIYIAFSVICLQVLMLYWDPVFSVYVWMLDTSERPLLSLFFFILHFIAWIVVFSEHFIVYEIPQSVFDFLFRSTTKSYKRRKMREVLRNLPHLGTPAFFIILWIHPCMSLDRWILATGLTWLLFVPDRMDKQEYEYIKEISMTLSKSTTVSKLYKK